MSVRRRRIREHISTRILALLNEGPASARDVCNELGWPMDRTHVKRASGLLTFLKGKGVVKKVAFVRATCIRHGREQTAQPAALYGLVT